jgi:hypothetical protein
VAPAALNKGRSSASISTAGRVVAARALYYVCVRLLPSANSQTDRVDGGKSGQQDGYLSLQPPGVVAADVGGHHSGEAEPCLRQKPPRHGIVSKVVRFLRRYRRFLSSPLSQR